jgi:glycosyltransferase involved in cell wall biosynthesis
MINILEVLPAPGDASSFYRGRLPLLRLQQKYPNEIMIYPYHNGSVSWDFITLFDLVFIQRPADKHYYNILAAAKRFGIPVWIDYDDLLCNIPTDNPAHDAYTPENIKKMGEFINDSDVITISTPALKKYLSKKFGNARKMKVIPNALDKKIFPGKPSFKNSKNILWRGSGTHQNDLMEHSDQIIKCMNDNPKWRIDFMRYNPFFITNKIKNFTYTKKLSLDQYFGVLGRLNHSICIVPLHNCPFNHSKSNIAWIESTYAGAVCLAPNFEEWKRPGIVNYTDPEDFGKKLYAMTTGKYDLKDLHRQSWQYISENLLLENVNNKRYELIMTLYQRQYQMQQ